MKKIVTIVVSVIIIVSAVLFFGIKKYNYNDEYYMKFLTHRIFPKIEKSKMTDKEIEMLTKFQNLVFNNDAKEINKLIKIDKEDIVAFLKTNKKEYAVGEKIEVIISIKNVSDKEIVIFPIRLTEISKPYKVGEKNRLDYALDSELFDVSYIKLVAPNGTYSKRFILTKCDEKGLYEAPISFSVPKTLKIKMENKKIETEYEGLLIKNLMVSYRVR